jgi:hypothetical protein
MPACAVQAKLRNQRIDHRLTLTPEQAKKATTNDPANASFFFM